MSFEMPRYKAPDFGLDIFRNAPDAAMAPAERDGIVPEGYHSTSMFPEYFKINAGGCWPGRAAWTPAWYTGLSQTAWTWWRPAT